MKPSSLIFLLFFVVLLESCNGNRPAPPDHWVQRVNNQSISKITFTGNEQNCSYTSGRHVLCGANFDSIPATCYALITFLDGTPAELWSKECSFSGDTLIFDDGQSSYFYGTRSNP